MWGVDMTSISFPAEINKHVNYSVFDIHNAKFPKAHTFSYKFSFSLRDSWNFPAA